jgi:hypothetical protein
MIYFGYLFIAAMLAAVIIPWVRRKSDLFTVWNLFLLGSANFVGIDSVATGEGRYDWGSFTTEHYAKFIAGALAFYICIFIAYYFIKFPRRLAGRTFRTWPSWEGPPLFILIFTCILLCLWGVSLSQIQVFAQLGVQFGPPAGVIAVTLITINWIRRPFNVPLALTFGLVVVLALILSVYGGGGRRSLMSLLLTFPIAFYWIKLRYKRIAVTAWPLLISAITLYVGLASYSVIRFRHVGQEHRFNPFSEAIDSILMLPNAISTMPSPMELLPSGTVSASLVCIDLFPRVYPQQPFQTILFILANPIPRAWWPGKPAGLGEWLGHSYGVWQRMGHLNISMGIVGHGYYEGGIWILVIYGFLFGVVMRFADELLVRQSDNPFMIGALAAASGNIYGLSRGEVSVFILLILAAYFVSWMIGFIGKLLTGVGVVYPTDAQREQMLAEQQQQQMLIDNGSGHYGYLEPEHASF